MSDESAVGATGLERPSVESLKTAGAWLRHYREERQVSVEELAAVLKIHPGKLEALERDDYGQLPDMVFTRALSHSICRLLGFDPAPVLALFPTPGSPRLARDTDGLNQPFKASAMPMTSAPTPRAGFPGSAVVLVIVAILIGAAVYFWPQIEERFGWGDAQTSAEDDGLPPARAGMTSQAVAIPGLTAPGNGSASSSATPTPTLTLPEPPVSNGLAGALNGAAGAGEQEGEGESGDSSATTALTPEATTAEEPATSTTPPDTIHILAQEPVWIQIRDASNAILHQSTLPKGRELAITNSPPLRVEIGRANAVKVTVKGEAFDIQPYARGNVARFEVTP